MQRYLLLFLNSLFSVSADRSCYGDIATLRPTGQRNRGVAASNHDVAYDISDLDKYKTCYNDAADKYCVPAAVIAGIASRESRGGRLLIKTRGYGDHGRGWGIMQCDIYTSGLPCKKCAWNSCCHIDMMVGKILVPYIRQVRNKRPSWTAAQQLQGGVAAYNFGVRNVQTWSHLDQGTTNDDYSNDVIARAKYLQNNGWD